MSMTREEFKRAFTEVASMEFADIPTDESEIDFTFSQEFLRKMDNLIALQQDGVWRVLNMARRYIIMVVIIIIGLFVTSCGILQMVKYNHHDLYLDLKKEFIENGGQLDMNAEFHELAYTPEGYELASINISDGNKHIDYQHENGNRIYFLQDKKGECYSILTEESVTSETVTINENKVVLFKNNKLIGAMWIADGIFMEVFYFGSSDTDELRAIIEGVE